MKRVDLAEARERVSRVSAERIGHQMSSDQFELTFNTVLQLASEVEVLRSFVQDLADHGTRFDVNPTVDMRNAPFAYTSYINRIDQSIRERATKAVSE